MQSPQQQYAQWARRQFLRKSITGSAALSTLVGSDLVRSSLFGKEVAGGIGQDSKRPNGLQPHFAPKAKRVIYLFQSGGPSQLEMMDYKPKLKELHGTELPDSIRQGQRLTGMTSGQKSFPVVAPKFTFKQVGANGTWLSELLPFTGKVVDDLCIVKSMHTEAINHDPAITFMQTGSQLAGRPSIGAWLSSGLGSVNSELPA